jgi:hypothetical protein
VKGKIAKSPIPSPKGQPHGALYIIKRALDRAATACPVALTEHENAASETIGHAQAQRMEARADVGDRCGGALDLGGRTRMTAQQHRLAPATLRHSARERPAG